MRSKLQCNKSVCKQYFRRPRSTRFSFVRRAVSSAVEHLVYTERVGGSKHSPPSLRSQRGGERRLSRRSPATAGRRGTFFTLQRQRGELRLGVPIRNETFSPKFTFYKAKRTQEARHQRSDVRGHCFNRSSAAGKMIFSHSA